MPNLDQLLKNLSHHYLLIAIAAVLFFAAKAAAAYFTYRHYNRKLEKLEKLLDGISAKLNKR